MNKTKNKLRGRKQVEELNIYIIIISCQFVVIIVMANFFKVHVTTCTTSSGSTSSGNSSSGISIISW